MKSSRIILPAILSLVAIVAPARAQTPAAAGGDTSLVKRGEYLSRAGDCVACHTEPGGGQLFAGGRYMETPFGNIAVPNITADKDTGIGTWSDDDFYHAIHDGIRKDGAYLYPVFPFPWYTKMTRDDALAIKAYLFSLQPVHKENKPNKLIFPASIRESLLAWRTMFFKAGEFKPDPAKSAQENRGAYLVEGLGHCGECHNKHNVVGASNWSGKLEGGEIEGWYAPNLTSDGQQGIGSWKTEELAKFLKTGASPKQGVALGPMQETISESLSYLTDADLTAMAVYLKAVPAKQTYKSAAPAAYSGPNAPGESAYLTYCASCHRPDGKGIDGQIPSLVGNGAVVTRQPNDVIQVVVGGLDAKATYAPMTAVGAGMSNEQVADVVNYVRNSWGNKAPQPAQAGDVGKVRKTLTTVTSGKPETCRAMSNPKDEQALQGSGIVPALGKAKLETLLQTVDEVIPKAKRAFPGASDAQLISTLTEAYCTTLPAAMPVDQRASRLGNFGMLTYNQLRENGRK